MKVSAGKSYKRKHRILSSIFISNPSLVLGFDLPFLIATSTSLKNAAAMSIAMTGVHIVTMAFSVIFARKLQPWLRAIVTVVVSAGMMMLTRELIFWMFRDIANSLGMYIYLLAVNGLTLFQSLSLSPRSKLVPVLKREFFHVFAFVITIFSLSLLREYFGNATLWGVPVPMKFKLGGLAIPFSGFIMMGFLMAVVRYFNHKLMGLAITESYNRQSRYVINPLRSR